ncbi:Serine/threonine-protein kinase cek1 [Grifola frondosa]|uniref:non-specific serine/threonine protein kinase n=1 Tax=Grifola frondosa TaxID=5627 RepID=A0A1C7M176_GRIFR|nr:Serine/threonine-protein kinase cek1 [Grifola frondosa]
MSEQGLSRRQPPSPLVFSPETVLNSIQSQPSTSSSAPTSHGGSGSNTVSMPFVRRHVTRRLKAAKQECDKELQRVTNSITAFFEERLREGEHEQESEREQRELDRGRDRESQFGDAEPLREPFVLQPAELRSALQFDDVSSDGGYEAEPEGSYHSRQRASLDEERPDQPTLTHWSSSPGLLTASASTSPSSLRRHPTLPRDKVVNAVISSTGTSSPASALTTPPPEMASPRKQSNAQNGQWAGQSLASRRLSRTIHIPVRPPRSGQSSRSTSRSRSPLPRPIYAESSTTSNRRSSRILVDDPIDPIMTTLYEIISVATDVTDMSLNQLTANPKVCEGLVQRVQNIGKAWDEHPDWHGRNWYVQVLLAVASLSRVVEWWEAEKQFWNFDDNDDEQEEPLTFVMKPADEVVPAHAPSTRPEQEASAFKIPAEDESRLRPYRTTSQGRRSRDEVTKDLSMTPSHKEPEHARLTSKFSDNTESARVLATERLRLQAETAQNQNIVMELSLDGDHLIWINYAWRSVVGSDPEDYYGTRVSRLLAPSDWHVFRDATRRLQEDDSHTVEVRFRLRVYDADLDPSSPNALYQGMQGIGMLMVDREDGRPSHSMWVVKPVGQPEYLQAPPSILLETGEIGDEPASAEVAQVGFGSRATIEPVTPFPVARPINTALILCRICECSVPQWFFEKHNETCSELRSTIRELQSAMDRTSPMTVPEYRGMPIFTPSTSPGSSSPLQLLRAPLKMKRMSVKKLQRQVLEQLEDILQLAAEVSVPALKEEESTEPIERQRLLSPGSERKMSQVRRWNKPTIEDAALTQLVDDAERVMRQKIDNVVRMQNTIKYSEKIRQEWEEKVEQTLASLEGEEEEEEEEEQDEGEGEDEEYRREDDYSSTTSEYAFTGQPSSSDPTPLASASPVPFRIERERSTSGASLTSIPSMTAIPIPAYWQSASTYQTRSSTPSSISSPLALAAPIVASNAAEEQPPPMDLNEPCSGVTIRARRSPQNLEPKLFITPPLSPMVSPQDSTASRRLHRRHSTAQPVISPTSSVSGIPLSPRLPSVAPLSRTTPTSIKDFEIIKPISKGAFGSVFLAKKKVTGDYFAIKVLKKADMIAKNQITNVKAERMILMKQAESPFVAKLYFTFQSKENLYLVMEYLNGGDCAALIKSLGSLPEEWTRNYIAEVVLGLEYLHQRGINRSPRPSNTRGTGAVRARAPHTCPSSPSSRPPSIDAAYMSSSPMFTTELLPGGSSYFNQKTQSVSGIGSSPCLPITDDHSESSGSESLSLGFLPFRRNGNTRQLSDSPLQSFATELTNDLRSHPTPGGTSPGDQKVVGTPDYLAPETILGLRGDDAAVDWWALGVITYEFLYGIPPFHDETPEKVFENILSGHIDWHEDYIECSPEARDFMQRLMTLDPTQRLGANGADEVKAHPFFAGIDWDKVTTTEAAFIPQVTDPESTDYFDPRGAVLQLFHEGDQPAFTPNVASDGSGSSPDATSHPATAPVPIHRDVTASPSDDDFGSFSFKNLPVLKQANEDMIRKLKTDQLSPLPQALSEPSNMHVRRRSISTRVKKPSSVVTTVEAGKIVPTNPPSPATSTSSISSSVSRGPPTPGSAGSHVRKPSEYGAVERFKQHNHFDDGIRRNSMPSRLRTASVSTNGEGSISDSWAASASQASGHYEVTTPPSSVVSIDLKRAPDPNDRAVTCLLAEDNPITAKIIETLLIRLGCRCVVVADGSEAISVAMGDIKFDCILMDLHMPILDGEGAARYIKSTNNKNANTPIIAVSAYSASDAIDSNNHTLFSAYIAKPVQKADLLAAMRHLGFKTSTVQGRGLGAKVAPAR